MVWPLAACQCSSRWPHARVHTGSTYALDSLVYRRRNSGKKEGKRERREKRREERRGKEKKRKKKQKVGRSGGALEELEWRVETE